MYNALITQEVLTSFYETLETCQNIVDDNLKQDIKTISNNISNLTNIYVNSLANNLNTKDIANLFGISESSVIEKLTFELSKDDILMDIAKSIGIDSDGKPIDTINDAILNSSKGNDEYYQDVAKLLLEQLKINYK